MDASFFDKCLAALTFSYFFLRFLSASLSEYP